MGPREQRAAARRATAEQQLREGEAALAEATAKVREAERKVEMCRLEIKIIDDLFGAVPQPARANGEAKPKLVTAGKNGAPMGNTAQAMAQALEQAGGKLSIVELTDRLIASGFGNEADRKTIHNNVSSVFYRAIKNDQHPLFRKAGRGEVQLASRSSH